MDKLILNAYENAYKCIQSNRMHTKCIQIERRDWGILLGGRWYLYIYHQNKIIYHQFYHQKTQEARE